jgi:uncharacterized delta-60 repeat protein
MRNAIATMKHGQRTAMGKQVSLRTPRYVGRSWISMYQVKNVKYDWNAMLFRAMMICAVCMSVLAAPAQAIVGQPGTLDTTFGTGGKVIAAIAGNSEYGTAVAIQSDGKIVVAGSCFENGTSDFCVLRYTAAGALDLSFSTDGKVITPVSAGDDVARGVVVQSDGKIVVAGHCGITLAPREFCLVRYDSSGAIDTSYGTAGKVFTSVGGAAALAFGTALQSDGKVLVVGSCNTSVCAARYNTDGTLDTGFDGDGKLISTISSFIEPAAAIGVQSDGKIILAGGCYDAVRAATDFCAVRYQTNGSVDATFGVSGKVVTQMVPLATSRYDLVHSVAFQSDGKIILGGKCYDGVYTDFCAARYLPNGAIDTTLDGDGRVFVTIAIDSFEVPIALALQSDNKIVMAGDCWNGSLFNFCTIRLTANGSFDTTFSGDGKAENTVGSSRMRALLVQPDQKILHVGGRSSEVYVLRYNTDGTRDPDFGISGDRSTFIGGGFESASALAVQPDGKALTVGYCYDGIHANLCAARFASNGSLDATFNTNGKLLFDITSGSSALTAVALQSDGKSVLAGYCHTGSNYDFCAARLNIDGSFDTTFSVDGILSEAIGTSDDLASGVVIQPDGKIVIAGRCFNGANLDDFCAVRYQSNGALDASFGAGGKALVSVGSAQDSAVPILLQPDGKLVIVGNCRVGTDPSLCAVRLTSTGALDSSFDGDGRVILSLTSGQDFALDAALQPDGKIIIVGSCSLTICVVRLNADGSLDSQFNSTGWITHTVGSVSSARSVALLPDGKILIVGSCLGSSGYRFCIVQLNSDGSPDTAFNGTGSVITAAIGQYGDAANAVALRPDGKIVVAGHCELNVHQNFCLARYDGGPFGYQGCTLDVDGDGSVFAPTDMLLATRASLGFRGNAVIDGVSFAGHAARQDWDSIRGYLVNQCGMAIAP